MKTDARVRYTKMRIRQAFLELLKEKPVRKITVTEICKLAEINRATFYKHYMDVYDLMEKIENEINQSFQREMENFKNGSSRDALKRLLQMMEKNKEFFGIIFSRNGDPAFALQLIGSFFPTFASGFTDSGRSDSRTEELAKSYYAFISAGTAGMIGYWLQAEPSPGKLTAAEMADRLERLGECATRECRS